MDDLTAFISARLDEDEAQARDATAEQGMAAEWHETTSGCLDVGLPDHGGEDWRDYVWPQGDSRVTRFIARHDPARVLREVEAGRKIVALHDCAAAELSGSPGDPKVIGWARAAEVAACDLAAIWSDHRDYRPEWKP